jgi:hypothetical protein
VIILHKLIILNSLREVRIELANKPTVVDFKGKSWAYTTVEILRLVSAGQDRKAGAQPPRKELYLVSANAA